MIFIITIAWLICFLYLYWMLRFFLGWIKLKPYPKKEAPFQNEFSIIIAIRNEAKNIQLLLQSLAQQNYPNHLFEIIIIDDHSEDSSSSIIQDFIAKNPSIEIRYEHLDSHIIGKKRALQKAYQMAKYQHLILTDGDCIVQPDWMSISNEYFQESQTKMLLGGVQIVSYDYFVQKFQALELLSLISSGAGSAAINHPIMSNGANLAFTKNLLNKINLKALNMDKASGDDVFLLLETQNIFGTDAIKFVKHPQHFVQTKAVKSWSSLIQQRLRWVSKSSAYSNSFLQWISIIVLAQNILVIVLAILSFYYHQLIFTTFLIVSLKILIDFFFLRNISRFAKQRELLIYYPIIALFYPFFISYTAIVGQFSPFVWKERTHRK